MDALPVKLPHGKSFQLVRGDCLIDTDTNTAVASLNYTGKEKLKLSDHFPGQPVFPGVFYLEEMAQTAIQIGQKMPEAQNCQFFYAGMDRVRFRKQVTPPAEIICEAKILTLKRGIGKAKCVAKVCGEVVCEAIIYFAVVPKT